MFLVTFQISLKVSVVQMVPWPDGWMYLWLVSVLPNSAEILICTFHMNRFTNEKDKVPKDLQMIRKADIFHLIYVHALLYSSESYPWDI